tara:strand:+ start:17164 stop:17865 length:702 start_codon:yes stop_codon:yes gene_type:complete
MSGGSEYSNSAIEAITGQKQITLTRRERKLERLRHWLSRENWAPWEALFILAGLDPELTATERKEGWWALPTPGADARNDLVCDIDHAEMQDRFSRIRGLHLDTAPPGEIIEKAFQARITIPWLQVAIHDDKCQLPRKFREARKREQQAEAEKRDSFDSRNRATSARHTTNRAPTVEAAQLTINELKMKGYPRHRNGKINVSAVIEEILECHPDLKVSERAIRNWIKEKKLIL